MRYVASMLVAVLCVLCSTVYGLDLGSNRFTVDGAFDYETSQVAASWWPDPNGGIGVIAVTDSSISGETQDNYAIGPCVTFSLTEAYRALFSTVLPAINLPADVPFAMYGRLGLTWDIDDDADLSFIGATGIMLMSDSTFQPTIWAEYVVPEGSADEEQEVRTMFGVTIWIGKP